MAKKTTTKKKTTASKKTTKKKVSKKPTSKKVAKKPAAPAKKPAAKKKTTTKKKVEAAAKKAASKKSTAKKKTTTKKKVEAAKKTSGSKSSTSKKKVAKAPSKSTSKSTTKTDAKADSSSKKAPARERFRTTSKANFKAGQAAAAKLAAAAGIHRLQSNSDADAIDQDYERLTKSPYGKRELRKFRELLLEKRAQLVGDVSSMESEALTGGGSGSLSHLPQHMADQGSDTYDQSLALDLAASQRDLLKEIDAAIDRIDANTFGICEMLGKPISEERLENTPWARFSIEAARRIERTGYHR